MVHDCCGGESCTVSISKPREEVCRECGRRGSAVARLTPESLLNPAAAARLRAGPYYFDSNPDCPVIYFSNGSGSYFYKDALTVRAGVKEREDPIPICYCFGHTRDSVSNEILIMGRSTVFDEVTRRVQAGECECEIRNPSGRCCLGDISRAVRSIQLELKNQLTTSRSKEDD